MVPVANYPSWLPPKLVEYLAAWRQSRKLILFIVFVALFLDNMLLTTVGQFSFFRAPRYNSQITDQTIADL